MKNYSIFSSSLIIVIILTIIFGVHSAIDYYNQPKKVVELNECVLLDIPDENPALFTVIENNDNRKTSYGILKIEIYGIMGHSMVGIPYERLRELNARKVDCETSIN